MNTKHTIVQDNTFKTIVKAVNTAVDLVKPTFGPASNKVIIDKLAYKFILDDGVQILRDLELSDPAENAVIKVIRETAIRTNDRAGDGTTGALIMLQAIINEVGRRTKFDGRKIELELKKALKEVKEQLLKSKVEIKTKEELKKVALTAFDNEEIAEIIADTYFKVGKDGVITIEMTQLMETSVKMTDGIKLNQGYISPYMVNNPERMETIIPNPYILLTDYRLTEDSDILPIMQEMMKEKARGLVIIAENVEQQALSRLIINLPQIMNPETRKLGIFSSVAITIPELNRKVTLEDIAILTGAKVFSQEKGNKLEQAKIADLGKAEKFICRKDESIIVSPKGDKKDIENSIKTLKLSIKNEPKKSAKEELAVRLGMFTNSLAVIKVGAPTENELKALKYKVEDAVNSVKSAFNHGVVCGSGKALSNIETSSEILDNALQYPQRQLIENMGLEVKDVVVTAYPGEKEVLNVVTGEYGDFLEVGVTDPIDVLIAGVESAVSIASLLLTASGIIVESVEEVK